MKPDVAVEWDNGETTENMSKRDLRKLNGMQQQPTFVNPILCVGEIVTAYPVNKKYTFNATICRIEIGKTVVVRWHEEVSDNITKGLPISRNIFNIYYKALSRQRHKSLGRKDYAELYFKDILVV